MIIVTGATGRLGRAIAEQLLTRAPGLAFAVTTRDPSAAADLGKRGVEVRRGDFADPDSLEAAFSGATQVLIVSSNASRDGDDPVAQHKSAADAARKAGARRVVYTSHQGVNANSAFPPMHDHAGTEAMLADAGIAWTALRNGFYASSNEMMTGDLRQASIIEGPEDGPVAWTTHEDLAAAAAAVLLDEGRFDGPTPPLNAGEAVDLAQMASIASELKGLEVQRRLISDEEATARFKAFGMSPIVVGITLGLYQAARAGEFAKIDDTLERLIGRKPQRMRQVLASRLGQVV